MAAAAFTAPGPGSWQLDAVHFPRPVTKLFAEVFPRAFDTGFREAARGYGALLDTLEFAIVNGFVYFAPRPVGAPKGAAGPPPKLVFKLLLLLHPELRRRVKAMRVTFPTKRWREDLRLWDEQKKPAAIKTHLALQSVDLTPLGIDALLSHLERCRDHWCKMVEQHHRFDIAALLPVGDFIVHTARWTGLEPAKICTLLRGASDVSSGGSPELDRLRTALRTDVTARALIDGANSPGQALAALRGANGELGAAARGWLDMVSFRLQNGLDISELTNAETPELLLSIVRRALDPSTSSASPRAAAGGDGGGDSQHPAAVPDRTDVRQRVPSESRDQFDELLAEARLMYRIRDERGLYSDIWAAGIMRHAMLEAGRRLTARGRLERPELILDAGWDEVRALLTSKSGPSSAVLTERAHHRATVAAEEMPAQLGPASSGPPPVSWMPPDVARAEQAVGMGIAGIFVDSTARSDAKVVRGLGVSPGVVEGIARVVHDVNGFGRLKQGDILVTRSTTAAFNVVLPLLGGIVTDRGGTLSHSAIVAREYGIPAVVGSRDATRLIPDGARLRLDGGLGEAVLL